MADPGFATAAQDFGGAVSDLFGAKGATASADSYTAAAAIAEQNAELTKQATEITQAQNTRAIAKGIGTQVTQVEGAGFKESGTALDLLRDSTQQGALTKALAAENGAIQENSYAEQAGMFTSMAKSATSSATGQEIAGIIQGAGGALNLAKGVTNLFPSSTAAAPAAVDAGLTTLADGTVVSAADTVAGLDAGAAVATTAAVDTGASVATDVVAAAAWIVCTELRRQGRMPARTYYLAAPEFAAYSERGKRGYWIWAIPSTRHLRAHPQSWYSRLLCAAFNCRARYIADRKRDRPTTIAGALATHGLYAFCWSLSWFVPPSFARWQVLYG